MSPWEDRYVRELVDELDRLGRVSPDVAEGARSAIEEERYGDALDAVLGKRGGPEPPGDPDGVEPPFPSEGATD